MMTMADLLRRRGASERRRRQRVSRVRLACRTVRDRVSRLRAAARDDGTHRAMLEDAADGLLAAVVAIESLAETLDAR
jgi:hypothetical protein